MSIQIEKNDSILYFDKLVETQPSAESFYQKALFHYYNNTGFNQVYYPLKESVSMDSNYYPSIKLFGLLYVRGGHLKDAYPYLLKYYRHDSNSFSIKYHLGRSCVLLKKYKLAEILLEELKINGITSDGVYVGLGLSQLLQANFKEAHDLFMESFSNIEYTLNDIFISLYYVNEKTSFVNKKLQDGIDFCLKENLTDEIIFYQLLYSINKGDIKSIKKYCNSGMNTRNKHIYKAILKYYKKKRS